MPKYVKHTLLKLQHLLPKCLQHAPHKSAQPTYGKKFQYALENDTETIYLPASSKTLIQQIIGIFLYYGIALDFTILIAFGTLATQQSTPTNKLWDDVT